MSQDVVAIKLSTGEELIARRTNENDETITLDRPSIIALGQRPDGSIGIQLMPWFASNQDSEVIIWKNHIVAETEPNDDLAKGYIKETTGILT
jgi:hypothetical protein